MVYFDQILLTYACQMMEHCVTLTHIRHHYTTISAALTTSTFYKKELFKPWILIPVYQNLMKNGEVMGVYRNSKLRTLSRHFEYLISCQNYYNCLNLILLYNHIIWGFQKMCSFVDKENGLSKINANYQLVVLLFRLRIRN